MTVARDQLFPQKPPGSRFRFSRTRVQPSPGSSTMELPSAFAESGAYPRDREPPGSPRQCSLPLACRHPPEGHQIGARKRRTPENTILSLPYCRRVSTDRSDREGSQLAASLEGEPGPTPAGKTLPHSYPETRFRRERARDDIVNMVYYFVGTVKVCVAGQKLGSGLATTKYAVWCRLRQCIYCLKTCLCEKCVAGPECKELMKTTHHARSCRCDRIDAIRPSPADKKVFHPKNPLERYDCSLFTEMNVDALNCLAINRIW